jgi:hypothetical protein
VSDGNDQVIEEFFSRYPAGVESISRMLRSMVRREMPGVTEVPVIRHNHIAYLRGESMGDQVVYICPIQEYVRLGFLYGGYLDDPPGMLEGTGKRMRHVKVWSEEQAGMQELAELVRAAWVDAEGRIGRKS